MKEWKGKSTDYATYGGLYAGSRKWGIIAE